MKILACIQPSFCAAAVAALALTLTHASAQSTSPTTPAATPVSMPVTVVNAKGDPVKDLKAGDLTLTDNGHIQTIQSFTLAQPAPMTFGIIAQTSPNQRTEIGDVRLATVHFVDHTLPGTDDRAFLIQYASEVDLLEDPIATVNKLHDAINQIGSRQFGDQSGDQSAGGDSSSQNSGESQSGWGGTLYDAVYLASTEVMAKEPGHHILILVGDGNDRGSKETLNDAIEAAQAAHTAIFAIYLKGEEERQNNPNPGTGRRGGISGPGFPGGNPGGVPGTGRRGSGQAPPEAQHTEGKEILEQLCNATGGYMVEGRRDKADDSYNKISALLKNQYTLSYTPDADASQSKSHHITLTSKKNDIWAIVQQDYTAQ